MDVALRADATLGEAPTWDFATSSLLWVDILGPSGQPDTDGIGLAHRLYPQTGIDDVMELPQHVGAVKPRIAGGLVANLRDGIALLDNDGGKRWLVYWARDGVRGNDAAVDPSGSLWAGTVRYDGARGGWLARVRPDGRASVVVEDTAMSNGIGWSPDGTRMYYVDSPSRRIDVFDFDVADGEATNRRPLCTVDGTPGGPDGLCVDADGCVWVALWGGGAIRRYTPDGALDRETPVPVSQPTACCFGGGDLTDLFITTARAGLSEEALAGQPLAGSILVLPGAGAGLPTPVFTG